MMKGDERRAKAAAELKKDYASSLIELFGENYETHPKFMDVVSQVASGRSPCFVLSEIRMGI